jgi:hypothetical protein
MRSFAVIFKREAESDAASEVCRRQLPWATKAAVSSMTYSSVSFVAYILRLFPRAWRWIKSAGTARDRRLRAATIGLVLLAPVAVVAGFAVLPLLAMASIDASLALAVVTMTVGALLVLVRMRSRQVSSIDQPVPAPDDRSEWCSECEKPRRQRFGLGFLRDWRYCPECGAAYCEVCKGLLWTSEARGWTLECLECGHEWSIPLN